MVSKYGVYIFLHFTFAVLYFQMNGADLSIEVPKICYLALLPKDAHNCIVAFIKEKESDEEFKIRVEQKWNNFHSPIDNSWINPREIQALSRDGTQEIMIRQTFQHNTYEPKAFCWIEHPTKKCKEKIEDGALTAAIKKSSYSPNNQFVCGEEIDSNSYTINALAVCPVIGGKVVATLQTQLGTYYPLPDSCAMAQVTCIREICVHDMRTHVIKRYTVMTKTESRRASNFEKMAKTIEKPYTIAFNKAGTKVIWLQETNCGILSSIFNVKNKTVSKPLATLPDANKLQALFKQYYICKDLDTSK